VHGESTLPGKRYTELDAPAPQDAYAISKLAAEVALRQATANSATAWVIIRPPLVYGPGVKANFAVLARTVARGWPLPLGAIRNQRSMVSVNNLADFVVCCLTNPMAANQLFLVSDGQDLSTPELARHLAHAAGRPPRLLALPIPLLKLAAAVLGKSATLARLSDNLQLDISKAQILLGWRPPIAVKQSLSDTMADIRKP
jgi:nucleoside-diphosphate-sugar epimerase